MVVFLTSVGRIVTKTGMVSVRLIILSHNHSVVNLGESCLSTDSLFGT
jgi:hypothetical protein